MTHFFERLRCVATTCHGAFLFGSSGSRFCLLHEFDLVGISSCEEAETAETASGIRYWVLFLSVSTQCLSFHGKCHLALFYFGQHKSQENFDPCNKKLDRRYHDFLGHYPDAVVRSLHNT